MEDINIISENREMVQAAPVGLPPKKDYVNFTADSTLMQLIGGGKFDSI